MKKLLHTFIMLALVLSLTIVPVMAEDDTSDEYDEKEIGAFVSEYGAQVRFLQLERSVTKNILLGERVVNHLDGNQDLELILEELKDLKAEIQEAYDDLSGDAQTDAATFKELKTSAIELTKEFHELARSLLSEEDRETLREEEVDKSEIEDITTQIEELRHLHNAERLELVLEKLGIENDDLVEQVQNGEATINDVKDTLREAVQDLSPQERKEIGDKLREHKTKVRIEKKAAFDHARDEIKDRMTDRRDEWKEKADLRRDEWKDNFQDRKDEWKENFTERREDVKVRMMERVDKRQVAFTDRIDNRQDAFNERIDARQAKWLEAREASVDVEAQE